MNLTIAVWYDRQWRRDTHSGTGSWVISVEDSGGGEKCCLGSRRTRAAALASARSEAAGYLDRATLRGLRQETHRRGIIYHRPESEREVAEGWPYRPMSVLVAVD